MLVSLPLSFSLSLSLTLQAALPSLSSRDKFKDACCPHCSGVVALFSRAIACTPRMQACSPASAVHTPIFRRCVLTTFRLSTSNWCASHHRMQHRPSKEHRLICCSSSCEPTTVLPNGLAVCYASKYDVDFLYREIFTEKAYLQHGIQLAEGNTVIDVGGNIGFFALFAAEFVGSHGTVITAEPIPDLHAKLQYNVQSHMQWCLSRGDKHFFARTGLALHVLHIPCLL